jgi:hypothetical protein
MAESEGFEPPEGFPSTVFKTAAFDHSASSPGLYDATTIFTAALGGISAIWWIYILS